MSESIDSIAVGKWSDVVAANTIRHKARWGKTLRQRFWAKVSKDSQHDCWLWKGPLWNGYGNFTVPGFNGGKRLTVGAHRVAYRLSRGPLVEGKEIDHLCKNRRCVNPAHLELVTAKVNTLRGNGISAREARQTHCIRGHEFNKQNLVPSRLRQGKRICKICELIRMFNRSKRLLQELRYAV